MSRICAAVCSAAICIGIVLAATLTLTSPAAAQPSPPPGLCFAHDRIDLSARISACSIVIPASRASPYDRAVAYNNRGVAHRRRGEYDQALADFEAAVRIAPNYGLAQRHL